MKKILPLLLVLSIVFGCLSMVTFAVTPQNTEMLLNGSFTAGLEHWGGGTTNAQDTSTDYKVISSSAQDGDGKALLTTKYAGNQPYGHITQNVEPLGMGRYHAQMYMKLVSGGPANVKLTIKLFHDEKHTVATYKQSASVALSSDAYKLVELDFYTDDIDCTLMTFYWYFYDYDNANDLSVLVDNCSLKFVELYTEDDLNKVDPYVRPDSTSVGAIRWDAYYNSSSSPASMTVADQVARTLSYYPEQAPYYAKQYDNGDVKLKFDSVYQTEGETFTWDVLQSNGTLAKQTEPYNYGVSWNDEATLAKDAGLDYFAYLWYKNSDKMSLPRKAHVAHDGYLEDGRQLKMCGILEAGHFGVTSFPDLTAANKTDAQKAVSISIDHRELYQAMASSCYYKLRSTKGLGEIPVLYLYQINNFVRNDNIVNKIRNEAIFYTAYLAKLDPVHYTPVKDIYFIAMGANTANDAMGLNIYGISAFSQYSVSYALSAEEKASAVADVPGCTANFRYKNFDRYEVDDFALKNPTPGTLYTDSYAHLAEYNRQNNEKYLDIKDTMQCVPLATLGRSQEPRVKTGVRWTNDYGWISTRPGTAEEIADNLLQTMQWVKAHPDATVMNSVLLYAWNEHDEGGYLCPTIQCDDNGDPLFDEHGNAVMDDSIIKAVGKAISSFHATEHLTSEDQKGFTVQKLGNIDSAEIDVTYFSGTQGSLTLTQDLAQGAFNAGDAVAFTMAEFAYKGQNPDYRFMGWYREEYGKRVLLSTNPTVKVMLLSGNETFYASFTDASQNEYMASFVDYNGKVIRKIALNDLAVELIPGFSVLKGRVFEGWKFNDKLYTDNNLLITDLKKQTRDVTVSPSYTFQSQYSVTVNGITTKVDILSLYKTEEAPAFDDQGRAFSYWQYVDAFGQNSIASLRREFSFYVVKDTELVAVYGEETGDGAINIIECDYNDKEGYISVSVERDIRSGCTVLEHGVLVTKNNDITVDDLVYNSSLIGAGVSRARANGTARHGTYLLKIKNIKVDNAYRIRGYVVYVDERGVARTMYTDVYGISTTQSEIPGYEEGTMD